MKTWIMPQYRPSFVHFASVQFGSVRSLDRLGRRGDLRDDSAEILFQSCLQEALVSSSGTGRDVHSLMLSIQHFLCRSRRRSPSMVALKEGFGEIVVACDMPVSVSRQWPEEVPVNPSARNSVFLISAFRVHSPSFLPNPLLNRTHRVPLQ